MRSQLSPRPRPHPQKLRGAALAACLPWLLAAFAALGCLGGAPASDGREWRWLVESKRALDADRDRLAVASPDPSGAAAASRERDVARRAAAYQRRLQRYIERHRPEAGEPASPRELAALHMRSDEEVRAARDFVDRAGDYRQAIAICESALALDPGYPPLERQLAAAAAGRYVTAERFAKVKPGMAPAAVRGLLGPPNLHNVRDYPQRGLVAWFYPKDATGAAAAVWFKKTAAGPGPVFQADFDAVDPGREIPGAAPAPASSG